MLTYGGDGHLKKLADQRLGQPDRLVLEPALDAGPAVVGLIKHNAGRGWTGGFVGHAVTQPIIGMIRSASLSLGVWNSTDSMILGTSEEKSWMSARISR